MNESISDDLLANSTRAVFFCPSNLLLILDSQKKVYHQLGIAITAVVSPVPILMNILVILAIKKNKELQTNSSILITSLTASDLLVSAVSAPLIISLDAIILRGTVSKEIVCNINDINRFMLSSFYRASYYHLILLSWERYVAIVKPIKYKVIVTKKRLTRFALIAWITALISPVLFFVVEAPGVVGWILRIIYAIVQLIVFTLLVYFYCMVYIKIRKRNRSQISQVNALIKAKIERRIAFTAFLLTVATFIAIVPLGIVYILALRSPFFRKISLLRWAEIFLRLNSLVNPALYFYRNKRYRKAALKLLRFGTQREIRPAAHMGHLEIQHQYSSPSVNVKELVSTERPQHLTRSQSWSADTCIVAGTVTLSEEPAVAIKDRRMSCPPLVRHQNQSEVIQPFT